MSTDVRLAVRRMEIPTCVLGPDSPYPSLMLRWEHGYYPYSGQLDIQTETKPVQHRVVVLENDYVEAVILPDMGGRLYSLFDKVARQHTFMVPPTVKYQNISLRGAWIAGGIELNFGHRGHNVCTVNPVSWCTRTEPDGSASVHVGAVVRPSDARWSVRYNLRPDRSALDLNIKTMAPQVLPGLMYWWTNAAVEVGDQSRFYYFGHKANGHAIHSWPIADGLNYQWYRNRLFGSDMFLSDPQRDYMAFYDYERHHGLAQIANRYLAPGQKYFTWGCDARGKFWDLLLSDSEQTYCEIQRGRLETQGMTEPIPPMSVDGWTETWMPIHKTEGFSGLENDLVLSVVPEGEKAATVRLLGIVPRCNLKVEAFSGSKRLDQWTVDRIVPGEPAVHRVELSKDQACKRVKVTAQDGTVLMDWTEFEFKDEDWTQELKTFNEATASLEDLFLEAQRLRFEWWPYHLDNAIVLYDKILGKDAGHTGALFALAEIDVWRGLFDKAEERLRKALLRRPMDPALQMLLGWVLIYQDRAEEAVAAFMTAGRYEPNRRNGLCGAVAALLKAGQYNQADQIASELLALYPNDRWAMVMKTMTARKTGNTDVAAKLVADLLAIDPLWNRATAEALLLGVPTNLAEGERKLADDSVVAAGPYLELGLWDDAAAILAVDETDESFSPAIRLSHLLYTRHRLGDKAGVKAALNDLRRSPVEQANPWSMASLIVLKALATEYPEESLVQVMLGNILASRKQIEPALAAWKKALDLGFEHSVVYRNIAATEAHLGQQDAALGHYRKAWTLSKSALTLLGEFDRFLAGQGLHKERDKIYLPLPAAVKKRSLAALRRVPQLLDLERYDDALAELSTCEILAGEDGERMPRILWIEAHMGKAVELLNNEDWKAAEAVIREGLIYPRNLNVGRRATHPSEAMLTYFLGLIAEMTGQQAVAREHYLSAVSEAYYLGEPAQAYAMLSWLALGNWPKAIELAHLFEQIGRGETQPQIWALWFNGQSSPKVGVGFARLVKGRFADCRDVWRKVIEEEEKDARWMRPHLLMSDALLRRIHRSNAAYIEYVHEQARLLSPRRGGAASGGNGQCNTCSKSQDKPRPTAKRTTAKKPRA